MKQLFESFKQQLKKEFPDLQDIELSEKNKMIELSLWPYTTEGMNNLDDACRKTIRNGSTYGFKNKLRMAKEEECEHEESIFIKIKI